MKKFVVILTFAAVLDLLTGCEEEKVVEFGSLQQRGGVYVVPETQKPYSGKFVETEKNIVIKAGSLKNGKLHGELTTYRKDGSIDKVQTFAEDVLNGKSESYYENGKLVAVMHLKDGELDGKSESYYENGKLMAVMHFKEGKPDGKIEVYSENGQLIAVMQDGKEEVYSESEFKLVEQKLAEATKLFIRRNLNRGKELLDAKKEAR
jgi:antitoxin component YwqK of YwqJK toxin-antitoxin module